LTVSLANLTDSLGGGMNDSQRVVQRSFLAI